MGKTDRESGSKGKVLLTTLIASTLLSLITGFALTVVTLGILKKPVKLDFSPNRKIKFLLKSPARKECVFGQWQKGIHSRSRKNRTLEDIERTILIDSGIAKHFWAEAVNTACYLVNRCTIKSLLNKTPYELLNGRKPKLTHLRIFGCKCFVLKNIKEALKDADWITAMQDEPHQFERNSVWNLVPRPAGRTVIGTRLVFKNKLDEFGNTTRNKARLVVQGYNQEEGIDYDETFALVVRMEAIRLLIAFASHMEFKLFQMDVKSAFLNGFLKEEVFIKKPPGFE
ncbi:uncharacterized protein [Nicotiana tomentosiformis]|uniref:uncharacterized protein n=1 Tax=Nicotiana tomentosiformis TaxID=4098 RepID=UPI00388CBB01